MTANILLRPRILIAICLLSTLAAMSVAPVRAQQGAPEVDVATPLSATVVDWDEYTGRFEAVNRVELRARVSGYLQEVRFRDGQLVKKGDVLFVIDPRPFAAAKARAEANLAAAKADQTRSVSELRRAQQLVANRTVSETTLDERRAAKLRADAEVAAAEADLRAAELDLEFSTVRAPIDGRISDRRVDVGNLVAGGSSGASLLATMVSMEEIYFVFNASEADFLKYARLARNGGGEAADEIKSAVYLKLRDETVFERRGQMNFLDIELDPNAGTIRGRAVFENQDGLLTPGLFGRLRLAGSKPYPALLIPDVAIQADQARKFVLVAGPENKVAPRFIKPGPVYRGLRVVRSGLSEDDKVIVNGLLRARPGAPVTPNEVKLEFKGPAPELSAAPAGE